MSRRLPRPRPFRAPHPGSGLLLLACLFVPAAAGAANEAAAPAQGIETKLCIVEPSPGAPLEEFGPVLWRRRVMLGPGQSACLGDLFYEEGTAVEFGLIRSRFRDRLYFRTPRRILREWTLPAPGQPDSALAWADAFASQFSRGDSLFVDLRPPENPLVARGSRGALTGQLFRHWVARELTPADHQLAARLGVAPERLRKPPPEPVCPPGGG